MVVREAPDRRHEERQQRHAGGEPKKNALK